MKIVYGYDIMTFNGPLPNCLNPKFIPTIYEGSQYDYRKSYHYFNEKWKCDFAVFNSHDYNKIINYKSVYEIINDRKNGNNYRWFYIIEPHSGLDLFFGQHLTHNEFALNFISDNVIDEIVNYDGNLLINYTVDGGLGINLKNFKKIIDFTRDKNIPDEKVYFIFADYKLKRNFEKLNVGYKVLDFNFYLIFKSHEFNHIYNESVVQPIDYVNNINQDKKDFLMLTRHWKQHRIFLINKLHRLGLDNSLISWEKSYYDDRMINELFKYDENKELANLLKTESRHVDVKDLINVSGYGFENKKMYLETYISIVTESIFFQNDNIDFLTGFLSEKIWKPIGHCQPFILAAPSKSLEYIRNRFGFKTFHPYIDETYDVVNNDMDRLNLIQIEIEKFSKKTKEEKIQFLNDVKDICIYNQNLFLSYGKNYELSLDDNTELKKVYDFLSK
jgi:hypothetical protein